MVVCGELLTLTAPISPSTLASAASPLYDKDQNAHACSSPGNARDSESSKCVESVSAGRMIARNLVKLLGLMSRGEPSERGLDVLFKRRPRRLTYLVCTCSLESSMFISESVTPKEKAKQIEVVTRGISQVQSQRSDVNESKGAGAKMINPLESKVRPDVTCRRARQQWPCFAEASDY
jgi:hypothetical protein